MELTTYPITDAFFEDISGTQVAWLGMAGALINTRGHILLIDPIISLRESTGQPVCEVGYRLKVPLPIEAGQLPGADLVMYTHADDDHFGLQTAKTLADRLPCRFLAPGPVARMLVEGGIPAERVITARDFAMLSLGPLEITVTPALHNWQPVNPWQREDCCGYLIRTPDGSIWHPGDTRLIDELLAYKNIDVLFFDVAAVDTHLGPEGSAKLAASCNAKVLIAYHYGTFDMEPGSFANCDPLDALPYLKDVPGKYLLLNPGEPLRLPLA